MGGTLVKDFKLLILLNVGAQKWVHWCSTLIICFNVHISPDPIFEADTFFSNTLLISTVELRLSVWNICAKTRFLFEQLATPLFVSSWQILETTKMKLMACELGASLVYHISTLEVLGTCDRTRTTLYRLRAKSYIRIYSWPWRATLSKMKAKIPYYPDKASLTV